MKNNIELTSIKFSHYNEKVRWVLEHFNRPYDEVALMPVMHFFVTPFKSRFKGKSDNHSGRFSTPILKIDNQVISDSSRICEFLNQRFVPNNTDLFLNQEAKEMDLYFNKFLGPHTRKIFYYYLFQNPEVLINLASMNVGPKQAILFKFLFTGVKDFMKSQLNISPKSISKSLAYIEKEFKQIETILNDGRKYIFGSEISIADISFACLGGAIILPTPEENYRAKLPDYNCGITELVDISKSYRDSKVGKWVLEMYLNRPNIHCP